MSMLRNVTNSKRQHGMVTLLVALVVLGGLFTSTILDFFVTPTVFLKFGKRASAKLVEAHHRRAKETVDDAVEQHSSQTVLNVAGPWNEPHPDTAVIISASGISLTKGDQP